MYEVGDLLLYEVAEDSTQYLFELEKSFSDGMVRAIKGSILYYDGLKWRMSSENFSTLDTRFLTSRCRPATYTETEVYCKTNGI